MVDPRQINSVIFDFDGTLCSGRYFEPLGSDALDAIGSLVFGDNATQWADPWMKGEFSSRDIASYLSKHLPESEEEILSALRQGCSQMTFNAAVYDFAIQQRAADRKTALVTANMDVFTETVVPAHGFDALFNIVLNTADHRTLDKSALWRAALTSFGPTHSFSSALLIDDSPRMITLFSSLGGNAYQYTGEEAFRDWLEETGFFKKAQHETAHTDGDFATRHSGS